MRLAERDRRDVVRRLDEMADRAAATRQWYVSLPSRLIEPRALAAKASTEPLRNTTKKKKKTKGRLRVRAEGYAAPVLHAHFLYARAQTSD